MKKIILSLFLTFALLILSNVESSGQCDSCEVFNYTRDTLTMNIGPCLYEVEVCFKCAYTNPGEVCIVGFNKIDTNCINGLNDSQALSQIYQEISTGGFIYSNFCITSRYQPPPCQAQNNFVEFIIIHSYCWNVTYRYNGVKNIYWYKPCDDSPKCETLLKYCYDLVTRQINTISITNLTGPITPNCYLQHHQIEIPQVLDEVSECFLLNTVPCGID